MKSEKKIFIVNKVQLVLLVVSVLFFLVGAILAYNAGQERSYQEESKKMEIEIIDKSYPGDKGISKPCHFVLDINVQNNGKYDITRYEGIMRFYDKDGNLLSERDVRLKADIKPGEVHSFEIEVKSEVTSETIKLHNTPLSQLKITWEPTMVRYEKNNREIEINNAEEFTVKNIDDSFIGQSSQEKDDAITKDGLEIAINIFKNGECGANGYSAEVGEALEYIAFILHNNCAENYYGEHFKTIYTAAESFDKQGAYGQACWLYDVLGYYGYGECIAKRDRCSDMWFLNEALESIYKQDDSDSNLWSKIGYSLDTISGLLYNSDYAETISELVYIEAIKYKEGGQCNKAYYLFEQLYYVGYKDAYQQMLECQTN